jgi:hypothetical protein
MRWVYSTFFQTLFEVLERDNPFVCTGSAMWLRPLSGESPLEQEGHVSGDSIQTHTRQGRLHLHGGGIRAVGEPILADRSLHWHLTGPEEATGNGCRAINSI